MLSVDLLSLAKAQSTPTWTHTPEEIMEIAKELAQKEVEMNDYVASLEDPTVESLLIPYTKHENESSFLENQIVFYQDVSADKAKRDASTKAEQLLQENGIEQSSRGDVFKVLKKLHNKVKDADESVIDKESKRFLDKVVTSLVRSGLDLPDEKRDEVKKLKVELSNLSVKFSKNLNEENGFVLFTLEELDGVPQDVIDGFEKTKDGEVEKLKMTFKYPDLFPVLKYAKNQETRKAAYTSNQNKVPENAEILEKMVKLRFELAKLLGYETYSEFILEDRLAKNQKTVLDFLDDLTSKLKPLGEKELISLKEFKNQDLKSRSLPTQDEIFAWDSNFYDNLLLEKEYQVDHQKISEYFPMNSTIDKMLGFYEHLFDIKFVKVENSDPSTVWHEDVIRFAVYQNIKYGELEFIGWILFDLHPREGKYGHAANFGLGSGYEKTDGTRQTPYTVLVCNFTKPSKNKPSLLKHNEVTTFFHELGHGVHNILSKTKYVRFHGTHVPRDFVETPSQMLEFWTWSKNELKQLSSHFETGEPISDELIDQLIKSKHVNTGLFNLRQLHFGTFDMRLHTVSDKEKIEQLDMTSLWNDLREEIALFSNGGVTTKGYASFGHIAGGYQSGYYGYLFSQVYANDIYYNLFKEDPMNVENGIRYRDLVLKKGGSEEILDVLTDLLGRPPNSDAFLEELLSSSA